MQKAGEPDNDAGFLKHANFYDHCPRKYFSRYLHRCGKSNYTIRGTSRNLLMLCIVCHEIFTCIIIILEINIHIAKLE